MSTDQESVLGLQEMPLKEFLEVCSRNTITGFAYLSFKLAYNIWAHYKDQRNTLLVVGNKTDFFSIDPNMRLATEELKSYGIYLQQIESIREERKYLIVLPNVIDETNIRDYCRLYVEKYLPEGKIPDHFVLEHSITDLSQLDYWTKLISEIFPGCTSLNSYKELQEAEANKRYHDILVKDLEDAGVHLLDVDSTYKKYLNISSSESSTRNTERLWPSVLALINEIIRIYQEEKKKLPPQTRLFLTFGGEFDKNKTDFAAYMFYQHGIPFYFDRISMSESYSSAISALQFNFGRMLIEDQIAYVKEFPDLSIVRSESTDFISVTLNRHVHKELDWLEGKIRVKALEVLSNEEISGVSVDMSLSLSEITIYPLHKYFKSLLSNDVSQIRNEAAIRDRDDYGRLLSAVLSLGEALAWEGHTEEASTQYFVDLTKVLMFEYDGKLFFSYVYDWNFSFKVILKTIDPDQPSMIINVDRDNLHRFLPIMSMPFKVEVILKTLLDVRNEFGTAIIQLRNKGSELSQRTKDLLTFLRQYSPTLAPDEVLYRASFFSTPKELQYKAMHRRYVHDNAIGILFETFYRKDASFIFESGKYFKVLYPGLNLKIIGLWCPRTVIVRQTLIKILGKNIKLTEHRKRYNFFSVFGGPLPIFEDVVYHLEDKVDITEEFLKE